MKTKEAEVNVKVNVPVTPEPRRLSLPGRFTCLPDLSTPINIPLISPSRSKQSSSSPVKAEKIKIEIEDVETPVPADDEEELSSNCSTPTLMEIKNIRKV